jgi:agmatine/peptidylarginine deiminase
MRRLISFFIFISSILFAQPPSPVRMIAEWEPALGSLIRWPLGIPSELVVALAEDDSLYILVEDSNAQQQAISSFSAWGVNLDQCRFILADTYSHWTRDWGPQCMFDGNGDFGIIDPYFDGYPWVPVSTRNWSIDDAVNSLFAQQMGWNNYLLPAYLTGGNVMYDGYGSAFSSMQMLHENLSLMNFEDFFDLMSDFAGIENFNIISNFENYGIQHIDCVAKLLDEETVLIKEVDFWHPEFALIETVVQEFEAMTNCFDRPYNIIRIFCDYYAGNNVAAYTNSLILNKKVYVPLFNISSDDEAIATYQQAMPGYEIIGFPWGSWYYYDALHCRVMGIFDPQMIRIEHKPYSGTVTSNDDYPVSTRIIDYSQQGLIEDQLYVHWKTSDVAEWETLPLENSLSDSFLTHIPLQAEGTVVEYFISAASQSGKTATKPVTAPFDFFSFVCDAETSLNHLQLEKTYELCVYPNPFTPSSAGRSYSAKISCEMTSKDFKDAKLEIYNIKGQKVKTLMFFGESSDTNEIMFKWDGTDDFTQPVTSGVYLLRLQAGDVRSISKLLLLK